MRGTEKRTSRVFSALKKLGMLILIHGKPITLLCCVFFGSLVRNVVLWHYGSHGEPASEWYAVAPIVVTVLGILLVREVLVNEICGECEGNETEA